VTALRFNVAMVRRDDGYRISTDPSELDREAIWGFLTTSYWSEGIARELVEQGIEHSLPFGVFTASGEQAGFARVVTDFTRFGWIADVFVLPEHRGRGLGVWLVQTIVSHPQLSVLRLMLATRDAHTLYERFGFRAGDVTRLMERRADLPAGS
jgi:N-acetylglutamate synthase-like GNAT family acetyltransferase